MALHILRRMSFQSLGIWLSIALIQPGFSAGGFALVPASARTPFSAEALAPPSLVWGEGVLQKSPIKLYRLLRRATGESWRRNALPFIGLTTFGLSPVAASLWWGQWRDALVAGPAIWFLPAVSSVLATATAYGVYRVWEKWRRQPHKSNARVSVSRSPWAVWTVFALALFFSGLRWFEHDSIYEPSSVITTTPAQVGMPYDVVRYTATDGVALTGWWIAPKQTVSTSEPSVLLMIPGRGGNMSDSDITGRVKIIHETFPTMAIFLMSYRGYIDAGYPTQRGLVADAQGALRYLTKTRGIPRRQIRVYGISLGGFPAATLAAQEPTLGGLIVESSPTSIRDMAKEDYKEVAWLGEILSWFVMENFDIREAIHKVRAPALIFTSQGEVPAWMGQALSRAHPAKPSVVHLPHGGHDDAPLKSPSIFRDALQNFFRKTNRSWNRRPAGLLLQSV